MFRKQITAANYIFIFSWQKRIYSCGKYNCSITSTCLCSCVYKPEFYVDIVTLDHADVGEPFRPRYGWKSDAKMYLSADRS